MSTNKEESQCIEVSSSPDTHATEARTNSNRAAQVYHDDGAVLLDIGAKSLEVTAASGLKLAKNGHTVLIPQPSNDPNDPLNWSWTRKHLILLAISCASFLTDFQVGASIPCILPQAAEWHITATHVNYSGNLNILMLGIGGVFWIPFISFWGRAPVLFWTTLSGTFFTLGCTLAPNFATFYGLKTLQGFTLVAGLTVGLAYIQDMFFLHEQARKIGIWTACLLAAPYCGPLFGNFIISGTGSWKNVFWMVFGVCCFNLALITLVADESWYRRDIPYDQQPARGNARFLRLIGVWQLRTSRGYFLSLQKSYQRLLFILMKPIMIPIMIYYLLTVMWAIGINQTSAILFATPIAAGGYGFSQNEVGFLFFAPIVGVFIGEGLGHFFNDFLANRYIRKHNGIFVPEARLSPIYGAAVLIIPGLVLIGQTLYQHLQWAGLIVGWGMYTVGYMIASVAVYAYVLDSYPTASGEVSSLINFARIIGGFSVGYFQLSWGLKDGYGVSFGIQSGVVAAALMIIPCLHVFGARMRAWGGPLKA